MKKTKVISVRLKSLVSISEKCLRATSFDGQSCLVPKSVVFGQDYSVQKSDAFWIAEWFILKPDTSIQAGKKTGWYNPETGRVSEPIKFIVEKHKPELIPAVEAKIVSELNR